MSKHRSLSLFRNPELSDRELMLVVLHEVTRVRADVLCARRLLALKGEIGAAQFASLAVEADREAFAELEHTLRQFETRRQYLPKPPPGK
jgi:hypothetical protein